MLECIGYNEFIQYILELEELTEWGRFQLLCDLQYLESVADSLGELIRVQPPAQQTSKP